MSVVVDASVLVAVVVADKHQAAARGHLDGWLQAGEDLHAPAVWPYELANVLAALPISEADDIWGLDPDEFVVVDPQFVRPLDPIPLVGDATLAREKLGWKPRTSFEELIGMMVEQDLAELRAGRAAASRLG